MLTMVCHRTMLITITIAFIGEGETLFLHWSLIPAIVDQQSPLKQLNEPTDHNAN